MGREPSRGGNPLLPFLDDQGVLLLDGGMASELERFGADLSDRLWSARLLADAPELISRVHIAYLEAGADCLLTASYQATFEGFERAGIGDSRAEELLQRSTRIALEARDNFWSGKVQRAGRLRPLVAASIGPYGAFLADGSEYRGSYGLSEEELYAFHRRRWRLLAASGADLLACETIPEALEARALLQLHQESESNWVWFSFACRDGECLHDGTPLAAMGELVEGRAGVAAVGVNCTAPEHVEELVQRLREVTTLPIVVYPNLGEAWDAEHKRWEDTFSPPSLADLAPAWRRGGADIIGGCCRTTPETIRVLRQILAC